MDGTLYDGHHHIVPPLTAASLPELQARGHKVFLCTSRCLQELSHLPASVRAFPFDARVTDGGTLITDPQGHILHETPVRPEIIEQLDAWCRENGVTWRYSTREGNYYGTPPQPWIENILFSLYLTGPVYQPWQGQTAYNLLVFVTTKEQEEAVRKIAQGMSVVAYTNCLELHENGWTKADAAAHLKEQYGLDRIVCFGNADNDVEMLERADLGVSLANATPLCRAAADVVIEAVSEDGIGKWLKEKNYEV